MTTVVKLGGSVVTDKAEPETVDRGNLERAAAALAAADDDLVVVHGGGSFGHHHAETHGLTTTAGTTDAAAVREVHGAMRRLNDAVVDALADAGCPALPVHPLSAANRDADGALTLPTDPVRAMLAEGFVPVLHGDVVVRRGAGGTILSGDEVVVALAGGLGADRVGVCTTVPGVFDGDGDVVDRIESMEAVAGALGDSDATDVTGGMAGKVRALLALDVPASVFGLDDLEAFLAGGSPGTLVG